MNERTKLLSTSTSSTHPDEEEARLVSTLTQLQQNQHLNQELQQHQQEGDVVVGTDQTFNQDLSLLSTIRVTNNDINCGGTTAISVGGSCIGIGNESDFGQCHENDAITVTVINDNKGKRMEDEERVKEDHMYLERWKNSKFYDSFSDTYTNDNNKEITTTGNNTQQRLATPTTLIVGIDDTSRGFNYNGDDVDDENDDELDGSLSGGFQLWKDGPTISIRRIALELSLYVNLAITFAKLVAYIRTLSLSVLASLLDSVLDVVSQIVLNYTERHSSNQHKRSSALYPAGASRLEPIGVLTCAALMGMASFEVIKQSVLALVKRESPIQEDDTSSKVLQSFYGMVSIVAIKLLLLWLCNKGANKRLIRSSSSVIDDSSILTVAANSTKAVVLGYDKDVVQLADPTLEALAQDHFNDCLSNCVAALALFFVYHDSSLWFLDPIGAIFISVYIIYSWYITGKEQIEQLTGKSAPDDFIDEIREMASDFDPERIRVVDVVRAYHFGPKFLVEIEIVMDRETSLLETHDVGMELQYEIESREEVERCFVHIDYESRPYDEHVVSKVPALREKYRPSKQTHNQLYFRSTQSI